MLEQPAALAMNSKESKGLNARKLLMSRYEAAWYEVEQNTCALLKAVVAHRPPAKLSGDDIWNLIRLTWINAFQNEPVDNHWMYLKVPALAALFSADEPALDSIESAIGAMSLPLAVAQAAVAPTGMTNFYTAYRYSCRPWCQKNQGALREIIQRAMELGSNDQERLDLAIAIEALGRIPSPNKKRKMEAVAAVTPVVAGLDRSCRFPIINGQASVQSLLHRLQLEYSGLESQVKGFINLIGQFGISDALMIDVLANKLTAHSWKLAVPGEQHDSVHDDEGSELQDFDEAERAATITSGTIQYRSRHNKITNQIRKLLPSFVLKRGKTPECMYDVLVKNYDGKGRDLLVEAKPDPDCGAVRIAIGQLLDYRRHLPHRAGTDLGFLTITKPKQTYIDLLLDLQISAVWFTDESCESLNGTGKAWTPLKQAIYGK
jgi:hypothetical protein